MVSIIIVNYNSREALRLCIGAITCFVEKPYEIIIANNDIKPLTEEFSYFATIVENKKNIGFARAVNRAVQHSRGETLFLLNPDTYFSDTSYKQAYDYLYSDENIAITGCGLKEKTGRAQKWCAGKEITLTDIILNNCGIERSKKIWQQKKAHAVDWVSGAACFIKKEIFEMVGGFDENFFLYFEDVDLCKKVREHGKFVYYVPGASIIHIGGGSIDSKKEQKKMYYTSQDYYFSKHFGRAQQKALSILRIFHK